MALNYSHIANAPVLRTSLTSGSVTWTVTNWADSRNSSRLAGNNQDGTPRPVEDTQGVPTATATLEVLNSIQSAPEMLCVYAYAPHNSGSYGGNWVLTQLTLNMAVNAVSTYSATFEAVSGSVAY